MNLNRSISLFAAAFAAGAVVAEETVYDAVVSKLDTGGVFLAYMDIAQDPERLADSMEEIYLAASASNPNMAPLPFDISEMIGRLGFFGLDGLGASSKADEDGLFVNKIYLYTPEGRTGLLAMAGGAPRAIDLPQMAPANAALALDMDFDARVLRELALEIAGAVMGPSGADMVNGAIAKPVGPLQWTWDDVLQRGNTRLSVVVSFDEELPRIEIEDGASSIPAIDGLIALDGFGGLVAQIRPVAEEAGMATWEDAGAYEVLRMQAPLPPELAYMAPVVARIKSNDRLVIATRIEYLDAFLGGGPKLASTPEYERLMRDLPTSGNSFSFISAQLSAVMEEAMRRGVEKDGDPGAQAVFDALQNADLFGMGAIASVGVNEPSGIYSVSRGKTSLKSSIFAFPAAIAAAASLQHFAKPPAADADEEGEYYDGEYEEGEYYEDTYPEGEYEESYEDDSYQDSHYEEAETQ